MEKVILQCFGTAHLVRNCTFNSLNLPPRRCLPNTNSNPQPFVIVGDKAFKLSTNLLRPYPSRKLNATRVFNDRLSRCRRIVECAFEILANKWRIFHTPVLMQPDFIDEIVKACYILHNFVWKRGNGINFEDSETYPCEDVHDFGPFPRGRGLEIRDNFAAYFMGPGGVTFQNHYMYLATLCFYYSTRRK